jgi:hypothetical protein
MTVSVQKILSAFALCGLLVGGVAAAQQVEVEIEPPAPRVEIVPPLPFVGAVWVNGYWGWRDGRHYWVGGHYVHPRAGHVYVPHVWVHHGARWRYVPGHWRRH